ncbi:hypothetical protein BaRGS_00008273, partial [Batillaria attramentaria]
MEESHASKTSIQKRKVTIEYACGPYPHGIHPQQYYRFVVVLTATLVVEGSETVKSTTPLYQDYGRRDCLPSLPVMGLASVARGVLRTCDDPVLSEPRGRQTGIYPSLTSTARATRSCYRHGHHATRIKKVHPRRRLNLSFELVFARGAILRLREDPRKAQMKRESGGLDVGLTQARQVSGRTRLPVWLSSHVKSVLTRDQVSSERRDPLQPPYR